MLLYSKTVSSFIKKLKSRSRVIMAREMDITFKTNRFLWNGYSYPLNFVVFEDPKKLGHFDYSCYQIGIHRKYIYMMDNNQELDNLLRHELAHLYTFLTHQDHFPQLSAHGVEFKTVCKNLGWGAEVYAATNKVEISPLHSFDKRYQKIKKLLALAKSTNPYEAQAATIKANELLLKYNLQDLDRESEEEEMAYVKVVLDQKRNGPILSSIYEILQYFYVRPVYSKKRGSIALEVVGNLQNVELADYIAKFLSIELESYWQKTKREDSTLKGVAKKRSYMNGITKGFISKLTEQKTVNPKQKAPISKNLEQLTNLAYPRLSRSYQKELQTCAKSAQRGFHDGQSLSIRPAIQNKHQTLLLK